MKKYVLILLCPLLLIVTGCSDESKYDDDEVNNIADAPYEFGFDMMDKMKEDKKDENIFISPTSIYMALAMLNQGADNETKAEIKDVLHLEEHDDKKVNQAVATLLTKLDESDDDIDLRIANSIWIDDKYNINTTFQNTLQNDYQSDVTEIDAKDPDAANLINKWAADHTNDKIDKMVEAPLNEDFVSLLMNAVYFQGDWTFPFDEELTEEEEFTLSNGKTVQVPMMSIINKELYYAQHDDYQTVRLPYGDNEDISMYLFLPDEEKEIEDIQEELHQSGMADIKKGLEKKEGTVKLPKFTIEDEIVLNDLLADLGMQSAFDKDDADFSNMIKEDEMLWVSEIKHKTFLDVDEKGTEAAGATSAEIDTTSAPLEEPFLMEMDHPFIFMITDDRTNAMLFFGVIQDPLSDEA